MKIFEFISKYCQDLVDANKAKKSLIDLSIFPHDDEILDAEGNLIPVVSVDMVQIPVSDFLTLEKFDFLFAWKTPSAEEAFDNYISAMEILEGEDVISRIRKSMDAEKERLSSAVDLVADF